jgi:hypothetical protein
MHGKDKYAPSRAPNLPGGNLGHTYRFLRAFRIRLADGLECSKAVSTSFASRMLSE